MTELQEKAIKASKRFAIASGFEIVSDFESDFDFTFCDFERGHLVFADILCQLGEMPSEDGLLSDRSKIESRMASAFIANSEKLKTSDFGVRYDIISVQVFEDGNALLRHHINAIGKDHAA